MVMIRLTIMDYNGLSWTVMDCHGLSQTVMDYHVLSWTIDHKRQAYINKDYIEDFLTN